MSEIEVEIVIRTEVDTRHSVERRWVRQVSVTGNERYHADYEQTALLKLVETVHAELDKGVDLRNEVGTGYAPKLKGQRRG